MKKFLTKKATMIGSIVAAALVFILLVAFCARPVSVGYTYKGRFDLLGTGSKSEMTMHVNSFDKMTAVVDMGGMEVEMKLWYFVKDGVVCIAGPCKDVKVMGETIYESISKEEFKDVKEEALEDWDKEEMRDGGMLVDAFKMVSNAANGEKMVCGGAIATVIVLAVVDAALAALAITSVVLSRKKEA